MSEHEYSTYECDGCGTDFVPTKAQIVQLRQGKRAYCCLDCKEMYKHTSADGERRAKPYGWLPVKNVMPTTEPIVDFVIYD